MTSVEKLLNNEVYWEKSLERLLNKPFITKEEKEKLELMVENKETIINEIMSGVYKFTVPRKVTLKKPNGKKRIVYMYTIEERLVMGVVFRVLSEYFKSKMSKSCFSYQTGVCTLDAIKYLELDKSLHDKYCVKLDISSYFNSVSYSYLKSSIESLFEGEVDNPLNQYVEDLYSIRECYYGSELIEEYMGLIPGSSISNFFGNYCLVELDRYFENLEDVSYARYADDIVLFGVSKELLEDCLVYIKKHLEKMGLSINEKKYEWFNPSDKVEFLGLSFDENEIDISQESFKKMKSKIKSKCKQARKNVEMKKANPYSEMAKVINWFNTRVYKCYIEDKSKYGWGYYAFRYITTNRTLLEIDHYMKDRLRYVYTGKNIKSNFYKVSESDLERCGYVSLSKMYGLFKIDFDLYCCYVDCMK